MEDSKVLLFSSENTSLINKEVEISNETKSKNHNEDHSEKQKNTCDICNKSFSTLGNMRNHILTIHQDYRPYKCPYQNCNKRYSIESRYQIHLRTHVGDKPFVCKICKKSFNEKGNLKTHLRFHSELRPFKCQKCNKSYKTNGHLKDHIEIRHLHLKKYECKICHKKFGRISTLKSHDKIHTGEKNYKCKIEGCQKYFAEKGNMEMHYQRHLKKLNKFDECNSLLTKKKYGEKSINQEFECQIKNAIDDLDDNFTKTKNEFEKSPIKNGKKDNNKKGKIFVLKNDKNDFKEKIFKIDNEDKIFNTFKEQKSSNFEEDLPIIQQEHFLYELEKEKNKDYDEYKDIENAYTRVATGQNINNYQEEENDLFLKEQELMSDIDDYPSNLNKNEFMKDSLETDKKCDLFYRNQNFNEMTYQGLYFEKFKI